MNYLNLETRILHAPEYIGSDPTERATWLNVSLWSAQQENGGRIVGAATWKDRQWQQTCGVTSREVRAARTLLTWEGQDLIIWNYPISKEHEVKTKRDAGKLGGIKSGEARSKQNGSTASSSASPDTRSSASTEGDGSTERKGREKEGKGKEEEVEGAAASLEALAVDSSPVILVFKCSGRESSWSLRQSFLDRLKSVYQTIDVLAECRLAAAKIESGAVPKKTANGMSKFLFSWMDRATNSKRPSVNRGPALKDGRDDAW